MQDSFQADTIKTEPKIEEPKKSTIISHRWIRPFLIGFFTVIVIFGYFFSSHIKKSEIENARAEVLGQAMKIDDIGNFTTYKGQGGGLYTGSKNSPELSQKILIQKQLRLIKPLDSRGIDNSDGKIGFVFIGDSYTAGEFKFFSDFIEDNSSTNQSLVLVDATQNNLNASHWDKSLYAWDILSQEVTEAGVTANQIQVLWINLGFGSYNDNLDTDIKAQADMLERVIKTALVKYPSVRVVYLSSPRYAGLSKDPNFQEPQSYEVAFAVREIINRQERGELSFRQDNTSLTSEPALLWGPYVWSNDTSGNSNFSYKPERYVENGLILTIQGKQRYAVDLFDFWSSYEFSKSWFGS